MIVIWRFTGPRTMFEHSERSAQRLVAGVVPAAGPALIYEALRRLIDGSDTSQSALGVAVTASAIVMMPALGYGKLRLGEMLGSRATAGEGCRT